MSPGRHQTRPSVDWPRRSLSLAPSLSLPSPLSDRRLVLLAVFADDGGRHVPERGRRLPQVVLLTLVQLAAARLARHFRRHLIGAYGGHVKRAGSRLAGR